MNRKCLFSNRIVVIIFILSISYFGSGCKPNIDKLKKSEDVTGLINALENNSEDVRKAAAWNLGEIGDGRAIKPLITVALDDDSAKVSNSAKAALEKIDDTRTLIDLLSDDRFDVADYASYLLSESESITNLDAEELYSLMEAHNDRVILIAPILGQIGDDRAVEPLIELLQDENWSIRREAIIALGEVGNPQAIDPLIGALDDEEESVSLHAANALLELVDKKSVEPLIKLLESENSYTRQYAAQLLGYLGDSRALEPLKNARDRESYAEQGIYKQSIFEIGEEIDEALEPLLSIFGEKNPASEVQDIANQLPEGLERVYSAMAPVVAGQGVPEAAVYQPNKVSVPKLVVLDTEGGPHYMNNYLNPDLLPTSINETELVIVVGERKVELGRQSYYFLVEENSYSVKRIRYEMDITVREALSGDVIMTRTYKGSEPGQFPSSVDNEVREISGSCVSFNDIWEKFFCGEGFTNLPCPTSWKVADAIDVKSIAHSPDGQNIALGSNGVEIRRVIDGLVLKKLETDGRDSIVFSPDGQIMALVGSDGVFQLYRVSDWDLLQSIDLQDNSEANNTKIAFSPDGQFLAVGPIWNNSRDYLYILQVADGEIINKSEKEDFGEITCMSFTPDGQHLALGTTNGSVVIWNIGVEYLTPYTFLLQQDNAIVDISFSPDGQYMALIDGFGYVWIFRISDGAIIYKRYHEIIPQTGTGNLAFLPDERILISGSYLDTIYQWEIPELIPDY